MRGYYGCGFSSGDLVRWGEGIYRTGGFYMPGKYAGSIGGFELTKPDGSPIHESRPTYGPMVDVAELELVKTVQDIEYEKVRHLAP